MKPKQQKYEGHYIELRERDGKPELLIDKVPIRYGQLENGMYYLQEYAYDWSDSLEDLARKYIDYRRRVDEIQRERRSGKGGK